MSHRGAKRGKRTTRFTTFEKLVMIGAVLALVVLSYFLQPIVARESN